MKRILLSVALLSLLALSAVALNAQTRQRRVLQNPTAPNPTATAPDSSTPSRAPVLRGATRPAGSQPQAQQPAAPANSGPEEIDDGDVVRVNTTLVTLPVSVTDRDGRYIPNLRKEDFRLWEEGVEQNVAFFSSVDKPFSVVLMIDTSGSTRFRLDEIQDAAITFVSQLRQDDRVMVVSFDDNIRVLSEFTSDRSRLRNAIRRTEPGEGTKLYEAVDLVMNQRLNNESGRKAIVLFTDGVDTTSRHASYASNIRDAEELDALIYPVQYNTYMDQGGGSGWPGAGGRWPNSILTFSGRFSAAYSAGAEDAAGSAGAAAALDQADGITKRRVVTCGIWLNVPAPGIMKPIQRKILLLPSRRSPRSCADNILWAITQESGPEPASDDKSKCV